MRDVRKHIEARVITPRPDCKIWANACDRGYGRISIGGKVFRVHRVVWELEHGPIPDGLTIDHLCRVRNCVNTEHMELVTPEVNNARAQRFVALSTHCSNGHEWTPENTIVEPKRRRCRTCQDEYNADRNRRRKAARAAAA
jgi:hypothetical protein